MSKTKKYKPRTEAQKAARRERDRKRREAMRKSASRKPEKKQVKNPVRTMTVSKDIHAKVQVGVVAIHQKEPSKKLVKVTVIKEYIVG